MEQTGGAGEASIMLLPKVSEYLGLIMTLIFAFGLVFQLPVVTTLLGPRRSCHQRRACEQAQIRHRWRIHRGCRADAA
jgi:hypothetical protein